MNQDAIPFLSNNGFTKSFTDTKNTKNQKEYQNFVMCSLTLYMTFEWEDNPWLSWEGNDRHPSYHNPNSIQVQFLVTCGVQ